MTKQEFCEQLAAQLEQHHAGPGMAAAAIDWSKLLPIIVAIFQAISPFLSKQP